MTVSSLSNILSRNALPLSISTAFCLGHAFCSLDLIREQTWNNEMKRAANYASLGAVGTVCLLFSAYQWDRPYLAVAAGVSYLGTFWGLHQIKVVNSREKNIYKLMHIEERVKSVLTSLLFVFAFHSWASAKEDISYLLQNRSG